VSGKPTTNMGPMRTGSRDLEATGVGGARVIGMTTRSIAGQTSIPYAMPTTAARAGDGTR
jgi:hypothetical protein